MWRIANVGFPKWVGIPVRRETKTRARNSFTRWRFADFAMWRFFGTYRVKNERGDSKLELSMAANLLIYVFKSRKFNMARTILQV